MNGISVIIPVYNREPFLGEAIRSVLAQKYAGQLEIIVSDDGSTDRSIDVACAFGDRVKVVRKPEGCTAQGASGTRNRGIAAATQSYVAFLDSDDFYLPDHLNRMAAVLERRPDLGFVFSRVLQMREQDGHRYFAPWTRAILTKRDIANPLVSGPYIVNTDAFLFRRTVFDVVGVFDESYSNGEDGDLWLRISERHVGSFLNHYGAVYRIAHGTNQLTNDERLRRCAIRLWSNALARYRELNLDNRFHLFRLRFIKATVNRETWSRLAYGRALTSLFLSHPVLTAEFVGANLGRWMEPSKPVDWKEVELSDDLLKAFPLDNAMNRQDDLDQ
jgi:glycosyltransferase involved in cell wall biosynthesis